MAFDEYQFLRYYIPGSLYVIYVTALVFPILSPQVFNYLAKNPDVFLGTVGGVFAASLAIGYLIYSFYDWVEYNETAMGEKKKKLFAYIEREAPGWKDLPEPEQKESLDMIYLTFGDPAANERASNQIRGMWSHYNARKVCYKFVPLFAAITVLLSLIPDLFMTKKLYAIPGHWEWLLLAVAAILIVSVTLRQGAQRPLNEATTLDYFFIRNRVEENKGLFKEMMKTVFKEEEPQQPEQQKKEMVEHGK